MTESVRDECPMCGESLVHRSFSAAEFEAAYRSKLSEPSEAAIEAVYLEAKRRALIYEESSAGKGRTRATLVELLRAAYRVDFLGRGTP